MFLLLHNSRHPGPSTEHAGERANWSLICKPRASPKLLAASCTNCVNILPTSIVRAISLLGSPQFLAQTQLSQPLSLAAVIACLCSPPTGLSLRGTYPTYLPLVA